MAVGRRARNRLTRDELEDFRLDLEAYGAPPEYVAQALAELGAIAEPETPFAVFPENGTAVRTFLALQTQWRTASLSTMGQARILRTGLIYEAIEPTCRLRRIELGEDDFIRIQVMEGAALRAWAEEAKA